MKKCLSGKDVQKLHDANLNKIKCSATKKILKALDAVNEGKSTLGTRDKLHRIEWIITGLKERLYDLHIRETEQEATWTLTYKKKK